MLKKQLRKMGRQVSRRLADDRGDVPGWVLIAVMTVGLVMMIWTIAGPALSNLFNNAISRVRIF